MEKQNRDRHADTENRQGTARGEGSKVMRNR